MPTDTYRSIYDLLETLPVVSSHEHHWPDSLQAQLTLDRIIDRSYVGWRGIRPGGDPAERTAFLERYGSSSYFVWLVKGLSRIYGIDRLTAENWDEVSGRICARHSDPTAHVTMLQRIGRYRRAVQDTYWEYGSAIGHPELFSPTMRTDMFVRCFHPDVRDHDGNNPWAQYPGLPTSILGDYLDYLEALFTGWHDSGAVALKSASAYERPLSYGPGDLAAAARVFGCPPESVTPEERAIYEDTLFNWFCTLADRFEVPFQIHTGLGQLPGSQPSLLVPTLERHRKVRFVLFHMGYPWYNEVAGLLHNHPNVSVDMVWAPLISPTASISALHQYIEVGRSADLIAWGSDTWTTEEAVGALMAWEHVVAAVLAEKLDDGYLNLAEAERLAHKLMYRNASRLYQLDVA